MRSSASCSPRSWPWPGAPAPRRGSPPRKSSPPRRRPPRPRREAMRPLGRLRRPKRLGTLDDAQREQASFEFDSNAKSNWSNFPVPVVPRNGVPFSDMTEEQQQAAMAILQPALSEEGYKKTVGIMVGDHVVA